MVKQRLPDTFDFSEALEQMREGKRVARIDNLDTVQCIYMEDGTLYEVLELSGRARKWHVTQEDILSEDWINVFNYDEEESEENL